MALYWKLYVYFVQARTACRGRTTLLHLLGMCLSLRCIQIQLRLLQPQQRTLRLTKLQTQVRMRLAAGR
jgi:hypothetical protein